MGTYTWVLFVYLFGNGLFLVLEVRAFKIEMSWKAYADKKTDNADESCELQVWLVDLYMCLKWRRITKFPYNLLAQFSGQQQCKNDREEN